MTAPPFVLGVAAMIVIVASRYVAVSGFFAWLTRRLRPAPADPREAARLSRQVRREIGWSLLAAAIYAVPAGLAAVAWHEYGLTRIYGDPLAYGWTWLPVSVVLYLLAHDTWFYWSHRLMHRPWWFARVHAVHHASRPPTAWAAMAFHPWEARAARGCSRFWSSSCRSTGGRCLSSSRSRPSSASPTIWAGRYSRAPSCAAPPGVS